MEKNEPQNHIDSEHEIWVNEFDDLSSSRICQQIINASRIDHKKPIVLYINSPGGDVTALRAIIGMIKSVENPIITVAVGLAASAGCALLICGDKRFVAPDSLVMFHEVLGLVGGNISDVSAGTKQLEASNAFLWKLVEENCGKKTVDALKKKVKGEERDVYLTAEEAVELRLADAVGVPLLLSTPTFQTQVFIHKKTPAKRGEPVTRKEPTLPMAAKKQKKNK